MPSDIKIESCKNCGQLIGAMEEAFVYADRPVCKKCYRRLMGDRNSRKLPMILGLTCVGGIVLAAILVLPNVYQRTPQDIVSSAEQVVSSSSRGEELTPRKLSDASQMSGTPARSSVGSTANGMARQTPPQTITVQGSAYVVRQNGQSDILRGFEVVLAKPIVSTEDVRTALSTVVEFYRKEANERRVQASKMRAELATMGLNTTDDYLARYYDEKSREAESKATQYNLYLSNVNEPMRLEDVLKLIKQTGLVSPIRRVIAASAISVTTTDINGSYKFIDAPTSALVVAIFDTRDGFLLWALPVASDKNLDLFNGSALGR